MGEWAIKWLVKRFYGIIISSKYCVAGAVLQIPSGVMTEGVTSIMGDTIPQNALEKQCSVCKQSFPATPEFFHCDKKGKYGLIAQCKTCRCKKKKEWADNNREHINTYMAGYYQRPGMREKILRYHIEYDQRPEVVERVRVYSNLPERRAIRRKSDRIRDKQPKRQEQKRIDGHIRRARKRAIPGTHTPQQIQSLLKRQRHKCYYCSAKFQRVKGKYCYHIEHTFPISRVVGTDIPANDISYIVLSCPTCNLKKGDKFPWEWPEGGRLF